MRFNVEGADARIGQERVYQVDAASEKDAELLMRRKGVLVSAVHRSVVKTPAEALDEMVSQSIFEGGTQADGPPPMPPAPISYAQPRTRHQSAPNYAGLRIGASILMAFAIICYAIGGLFLVMMLIAGAAASTSSRGLGAGVAIVAMFTPALTCLVSGAFLHTCSEAANALRDIARNSFKP